MLAQSDQGAGQGAGLPDSGPKQWASPVLECVLSSAWAEKVIHNPSHPTGKPNWSSGTCRAHPATRLTAAWDSPAGGPACGRSQDSGLATEPVPKQESCQLRGLRGVPAWAGNCPVEEPSAQLPREPHENTWAVEQPSTQQCCSRQLGQCLSRPVFRVNWWPCLARELVCSPTWSGSPNDELCWPLGQSCCLPHPSTVPYLIAEHRTLFQPPRKPDHRIQAAQRILLQDSLCKPYARHKGKPVVATQKIW